MDIVHACVSLAPVPYLSLAFAIFRSLCTSIEHVQWSEQQLRALEVSIAQLLQTLDGEIRAGRLVESQISPEIDTLQILIKEINSFVQHEEGRGFLKLLFNKDERMAAIETYHRRLCSCVSAFRISALVNIQDWQKRNDDNREADERLFNDRLTELEADEIKLREALQVNQHNMVAMMTSLQRFAVRRLCGERERRFCSSTLNHLMEITGNHVIDIDSWMITAFDVEFGPEIVGSGGFGQVFKGVWNGEQVALKVLEIASNATPSLALIRREIKTWSTLRHPHLLQFIGANVFDDRPFIVMPFLKNGNARDYVYDHPECNRITILHHISLGLVHLHHNNVMHGDLKAFNVLIDDAGHAVLCDFGLSHIKSDITTRSIRQGNTSVVESRNWMSPERIMGGALRKPVDIYALGMTMFEILTGDVPLGHIAYVDFISLVVNMDVRPERPEDDHPFKISDSLWSMVEACWAKTPQDRPTALAVSDAISNLLVPADPQVEKSSPLGSTATPVRQPTSTPVITSKNLLTNASPSFGSPPPRNSPTGAVSGSFYTQLSTSNMSSIADLPKYDDIGVGGPPSSRILRIPRPFSGGNVNGSPFENGMSNTHPTTSRSSPFVTIAESVRPTTAENINRSQMPALPPGYNAEPTYSNTSGGRSPDNTDHQRQLSLPTWPHAIVQQESSDRGSLKATRESLSDVIQPSKRDGSFSPILSMSDACSSVESEKGKDFDDAGPSTSNTLSYSKQSPRKAARGTKPTTPRPKMAFLWSRRTEPTAGKTSTDGESGAGKQNRLGRMTSWFGKPLLSTQSRSRDVSGFKVIPPSRPIPPLTVEMWSMDDFIERWINHSPNLVEDQEFQEIFLSTYTAFSSSLEIFRGLRLRFDAAETADGPAQIRASRRHSIISAMKYWVGSPYTPIDPNVLAQMKEFANSVTSSSFMGEKAKEIAEIIHGKPEDYPLPSASESVTTVTALLDNTSEQMAAALTVLEGILYSRIRPADYINHLRELQCPNRVADACIMTRKITFWVKQKVLRSDLIKRRGKAFKFFLKTAEDCYQMRNFSSLAAIIVALESELVQSLPETLGELDTDDQTLLARLSSFVKLEQAYRTALDSSEDLCVPRLEFHLHDLQTILPSCLPSMGKGSAPMINIMGCIALAAQIRDVTKFKNLVKREASDLESLPYLLKQLASIEINTATNDQLRQRSRYLKAEEGSVSKSRTRALGVSGFAA